MRELGATAVVDRAADVAAQVRRHIADGVDVTIDLAGPAVWQAAIDATRDGGRFITTSPAGLPDTVRGITASAVGVQPDALALTGLAQRFADGSLRTRIADVRPVTGPGKRSRQCATAAAMASTSWSCCPDLSLMTRPNGSPPPPHPVARLSGEPLSGTSVVMGRRAIFRRCCRETGTRPAGRGSAGPAYAWRPVTTPAFAAPPRPGYRRARGACRARGPAAPGYLPRPAARRRRSAGLPGPVAGCPGTHGIAAPAATPWAQQALGFSSVWPLTQGAGVTVAVVDSGVDANPQFGDRVTVGPDLAGATFGAPAARIAWATARRWPASSRPPRWRASRSPVPPRRRPSSPSRSRTRTPSPARSRPGDPRCGEPRSERDQLVAGHHRQHPGPAGGGGVRAGAQRGGRRGGRE